MMGPSSSMSSVKLGLIVAWPAFWTGVPIKCVLILLLLAMGSHPWEMTGLAFLLLLSIPVDIWALSVTAKTVFLDRLRIMPAEGLGVTLWWQAALMSAVYLPLAYLIGSEVVALTKSTAASIMAFFPSVPIAERISIELVLWSSVAIVALIALALGWLFLFGMIVRKQTVPGSPVDASYPAVVRQWDLMRVPADQPLLLTAFTATGVVLVLVFWTVMPVMTPHPHETYADKEKGAKTKPLFKPAEALQKSEKILARAEASIEALEEKSQAEDKDKAKSKGGSKEPAPKTEPAQKTEPAKAVKK